MILIHLSLIHIFLANGVFFGPAKAANAGGVATSGLEMSQNSLRLSWTFEEVDQRLHDIMVNIFKTCIQSAEKYGHKDNLVMGCLLYTSGSCRPPDRKSG